MRIGVIWAQARGGVIGKDNTIPWRLPEDMAHFKAVTMGCPVIMGRKTWDSLPAIFRPLPGRRNIVVTRQPDWQADGAERAATLDEAITLCGDTPRAWVIGGAQIYRLALPLADLAEITEVGIDVQGDTFAPALGAAWHEVTRERRVAAGGTVYSFVTYNNTPQGN
ncbi:MAG: dihydrofolate reductase [Ramlibacter sp.]